MIGNMLPDLRSLNFCCNIYILASELGVNDVKEQIHPTLYQRLRIVVACVMVWDMVSCNTLSRASFKHHSIPDYCC